MLKKWGLLLMCAVLASGCASILGKTKYNAEYTEVVFVDGGYLTLVEGEGIPLEALDKPVIEYTNFYVSFSGPAGVEIPEAATNFAAEWGAESTKVAVGQGFQLDSSVQAQMLMDMTPHLRDVIVALIQAIQTVVP